jgi:hypothetical protein
VLVIAVDTTSSTADELRWTARRHDDDGPESTGEQTAQGLFDGVFHALHDGEQVSIGFDCPLTAPADGVDPKDATAVLAVADAGGAGLAALRWLIDELGKWRPWTIVTTSLARWRATTSVLVWEAGADGSPVDSEAAIDGFYAVLRADAATADTEGGRLNLAAAIAVASEATADAAELTQPVLRVALR